ncbi:MAG: hypothetical protein AB1445_14760 [Bacillota bacterium]
MTTEEIMAVALGLAGMSSIPGDSAIYHPGRGIRRVLFAVDMGPGELTACAQLGFDAAISHHPPLTAALPAWEVYARHVDLMVQAGVPAEAARAAVGSRVRAMQAAYQSANHEHFPSLARLLGIPFMNIHGPLDEVGRRIMQERADEASGGTVGDVMDALATLPEFQAARSTIQLGAGDRSSPAGKVVVAHGCLTNGGYAVADAYFRHGVQTVVYIHCPLADAERLAGEGRGNLVITGHIASDLVGINPFLQALAAAGVEVVTLNGTSC